MSDGYDILCIQKLGEAANHLVADPYEADDVTCACADYLSAEGYEALSNDLTAKRVMASAAQLIPTTTNILKEKVA
jgi:hypothetical protein